MRTVSLRKPLLLALCTVLLLSACKATPEEKPPEIFWPLPPLTPRVKFVDYIVGSLDATAKRENKFQRYLFGEKEERTFTKPIFVALRGGDMYVSDIGGVHHYDFTNKEYKFIGAGRLVSPTGIAVASDGTLYVGDTNKHKLYIYKPGNDTPKETGGRKYIDSFGGLTLDEKNGRLLSVDTKGHHINVMDLEGNMLYAIGQRGNGPGEFNYPYDTALDDEGNIFVMDSGNFRVQMFDPEGNFMYMFGNVGMSFGNFARPKGIAIDSENHVYVVDTAFGNFQIFDRVGNLLLAVGQTGSEPGMNLLPLGIAIDENDRIYVVDQLNKRVQIYQYLK